MAGAKGRRDGSTSAPLSAAGPLSAAAADRDRAGDGGTARGGSGVRGRSRRRWTTSDSSCSDCPCCRETLSRRFCEGLY